MPIGSQCNVSSAAGKIWENTLKGSSTRANKVPLFGSYFEPVWSQTLSCSSENRPLLITYRRSLRDCRCQLCKESHVGTTYKCPDPRKPFLARNVSQMTESAVFLFLCLIDRAATECSNTHSSRYMYSCSSSTKLIACVYGCSRSSPLI